MTCTKMKPLVSVVMPAYNAEQYIEAAIESVLTQTYDNFELVIVEDCSTDNTRKVIQKYKDDRIQIYYNERNRGIANTTNRAIDASKGKYIALLDDDDIAVVDRLKLQTSFLEENLDIDVLGGRTVNIDENGDTIGTWPPPRRNPKYIRAMLLFNNVDFANGTMMIRKSFLDHYDLHYKDNCLGMQDYRFNIESSKVGKFSALDNVLLYHRVYEHSETQKRMTCYKQERASLYAQFQRDSISTSGFILNEDSLKLINKVLDEMSSGCETIEEVKKLYRVFEEMLKQAEKMELDYYEEFKILCQKKILEQLKNLDIFD